MLLLGAQEEYEGVEDVLDLFTTRLSREVVSVLAVVRAAVDIRRAYARVVCGCTRPPTNDVRHDVICSLFDFLSFGLRLLPCFFDGPEVSLAGQHRAKVAMP